MSHRNDSFSQAFLLSSVYAHSQSCLIFVSLKHPTDKLVFFFSLKYSISVLYVAKAQCLLSGVQAWVFPLTCCVIRTSCSSSLGFMCKVFISYSRHLSWGLGSSVHFSRSVVSNSLRPHGLQHARPPCPSPTPRVYSNSCPSSRWCHPTISSSVGPFSSRPQSFLASGSFHMSQFFESGGQILEFQLQHQFFQWTPRTDLLWDGLVGSPCSPRDSQESFPTPQFKSINSSVLTFLYSPTLISIHDYWKNSSFD